MRGSRTACAFAAAVFAAGFLFAACPKINAPGISGTDGLAGYEKPLSPFWIKKEGRMRFYAESNDNEYYIYNNSIPIPGGEYCDCAPESPLCPCAGSQIGCGCEIPARGTVRALVRMPGAGFRGEAGVVFADAADDSGAPAPKLAFTINAAKNAWYIRSFNGSAPAEPPLAEGAAPLASGENTLIIRYDTAAPRYSFYINDDGASALHALNGAGFGKAAFYIYYYVTLAESAPSRDSPAMLDFSTRSPYKYP